MNKTFLDFVLNKRRLIVKILLNSYDQSDFEIDSENIEREIFQASLNYAKIFILEEGYLDEKFRNECRSHILSRFSIKERDVLKMDDIDLLAHYIKVEVIDELLDHSIILL